MGALGVVDVVMIVPLHVHQLVRQDVLGVLVTVVLLVPMYVEQVALVLVEGVPLLV